MWNSEPPSLHNPTNQLEVTSVMSFASSSGATPLDRVLNEGRGQRTSQQLEVKVDMVYSLLSMLGTQECPDMGETLLALSSSPESSLAMRQAGNYIRETINVRLLILFFFRLSSCVSAISIFG